jgi:lysophospholipase L1-like esterase
VPQQAAVVAIGDSMTYGDGVTHDSTWPRFLGTLLGEPIYNMSMGGYGPLQYLHLAQEYATRLRPRVLLVGLYLGNDVIDAYNSAHRLPHWSAWRAANAGADGEVEFDVEFRRAADDGRQRRPLAALRHWLSKHSVLYSMSRTTLMRAPLFQWLAAREADRPTAPRPPDREMPWADPAGSVRTTFTPQLRLSALDLELPSVREGLRITQGVFSQLRHELDARGTRLLVILIPTKERVYCDYLKDSGARMPDALLRLCDAEDRVKQELTRHFEMEGIAYVDVVGALNEQVRRHAQLYPSDFDGHPQAAGYRVIARLVYEAMRSLPPAG